MRKLRVGVWLFRNIDPQSGGGYGYYQQLIKAINDFNFSNADIIFLSNKKNSIKSERIYVIKWRRSYLLHAAVVLTNFLKKFPFIDQVSNAVCSLERRHYHKLNKELSNRIDVIYYLTPACIYPTYPYIYTLWDLGYLSTFAFPELSMNHVYEERKQETDNYLYKALMIFAESNVGKQEIIKYTGIKDERIRVVPIFPSEIISDKIEVAKPKDIDIDCFFIFYNAQFWAHKNHYNLLMAFKYLLTEYPDLKLILTGSDRGNKDYINKLISDLNYSNSIINLGFVTSEELKWLYKNSQGLVMSTFLGPTNIPLLEAAALGCPVACSNLPGHIEELGEYGYYFDPKNPLDIAYKISEMIKDKQDGVNKCCKSDFNIKNTLKAIDEAFAEISSIRFCWGEDDDIY